MSVSHFMIRPIYISDLTPPFIYMCILFPFIYNTANSHILSRVNSPGSISSQDQHDLAPLL